MKSLVLLLALFCAAISVSAQTEAGSAIRALTVGDTVPDITFTNIINYSSKTARLSDFKGKALIIDFFATWCGSCISALPKLDALKRQFNGKLEILIVSYEPMEKVKALIKKNKIAASTNLSFITDDDILKKYFSHKLIPHLVWIDQRGEVKAITNASDVTESGINDLASGKNLMLPLKRDVMNYDVKYPLLENGNGGEYSNLICRSVLSKKLDGMGSKQGRFVQEDNIKYFFINRPILSIYQSVLKFKGNHIILEVNEPSKYIKANNDRNTWEKNNLYSYELILSNVFPEDKIGTFISDDLNKYLNLYGRMEQREVSCWAIINSKKNNNLLTNNEGQPQHSNTDGAAFKAIYNEPFSRFVSLLNQVPIPTPDLPIFLDETGLQTNVTIVIPKDAANDMSKLKNELSKYGLDLIQVKRTLNMFVLTEKK